MTARTTPILVASDDQALVAAITHSLTDCGYRVCQGLDEQPHLIVLDAALPEASRAALLRTLRSGKTTSNTPPIVALSARGSLTQDSAIEGVWICLAKPVEMDDLVCAVDRISNYTGTDGRP